MPWLVQLALEGMNTPVGSSELLLCVFVCVCVCKEIPMEQEAPL